MGVGKRNVVGFLCDACGREILAEEGENVDGYLLEALHVQMGVQVSEQNIFACSEMCIERAVRDALKRATLPEPQKIEATGELWQRGRTFRTNPSLPVLDMKDETCQIGTAHEIQDYKPTPGPR